MKTADFDFALPPELIAQRAAEPRDSSKLFVIASEHRERGNPEIASPQNKFGVRNDDFKTITFRDITTLLKPDDLLVFNNSKVIPARLFVHKGEAKIEIFLHKKLSPQPAADEATNKSIWQSFAKPAKKLKIGDELKVEGNASVKILDKLPTGEVVVELSDEAEVLKYGHMPLPPYISRADEEVDKSRYQTVYAATEGSVAAPTAGLHFTPELLAKIPNKAFVTLHVGAGTFQPVKVENLDEHIMHSEWYEVPPETEQAIKNCKGRIIAVGTTSLRTLEASGGVSGCADTQIFIKPGYKFKVVDALITNFHLPKSTLFMLVCAMAGTEKMKAAYHHAIACKLKFFSYGDACFIENN